MEELEGSTRKLFKVKSEEEIGDNTNGIPFECVHYDTVMEFVIDSMGSINDKAGWCYTPRMLEEVKLGTEFMVRFFIA